jgi:hypothetical protein
MKKGLLVLICVCVVLGLTACGASGPQVGAENAELGRRAISLADKYLDGKTTASAIVDELDRLAGQAAEEPDNQAKQSEFDTALFILSTDVFIASTDEFLGNDSADADKKIKEYRNKIAKLVGEPGR